MSTLTATIQADTSGFNAAVEKASKELKLFDKSNKNLAATMKSVNKVTDSQVDAFNKSIKSLKQVADGNKNNQQSAKILKDELEKLNRQWRNLSEEAKKGQFGKAMSEAMRTANEELSKLKVNANSAFSEVSKSAKKANNNIDEFGKGFSGGIDILAKFTGGLAAADLAFNAVNSAIKNNETAWDSWQETLEGAGTAWKNFTRNFRFGNIGISFTAGSKFYQASDTLESFRALDKGRLAELEEKIQTAKTNKKEGISLSSTDKANLDKMVIGYFTDEANHLKNVASAKKETILALFSKDNKAIGEEFFKGLDATNSKFEYLEKAKKEYNDLKTEIENDGKTKEIIGANGVRQTVKVSMDRSQLQKKIKRRDALKNIVDSESDISEYVKLQTEAVLSEKEKQRLLGEILEASATPKKVEYKEELHEENAKKQQKAFEDLWKDYLQTGELKTIEAVKRRIELTKKAIEVSSDPTERYAYAKNLTELENHLEDLMLDTKQADLRPIDLNETMKELNEKYKDKTSKDNIEKLKLETNAVNSLASAWDNLWEVIKIGDETTTQTIKALGGAVTEAANMFKTLAENELAASEAVALGKASASASGLPFPYNLIAMGTVAATVTSMFAKFASIGKFAEGGIVGGNRSIGDYNIARVNSGEMILNGSQQKRLFHLLNSNGNGTTESSVQKVELVVRGKDLVGTLDNYNRHINRIR